MLGVPLTVSPSARFGRRPSRRLIPMAAEWKERDRRLEFRNGVGEKLVGSLVSTASPKTVILCHGFSDHRDTRLIQALTRRLDAVPFTTFRFDFSGNGDSDGAFEFANYWTEVEDLRSAVLLLRSLDLDVHAVIGHSKGGNDVLLYAARYDDVPFVVNVAGRYDMKQGIQQRFGQDVFERLGELGEIEAPRKLPNGKLTTFKLTQKSVDERLSLDMESEVRKIDKTRVLTIHGTLDAGIPVEDAHAFARSIAQNELCIVIGGDHNFTDDEHLQSVADSSAEFLTAKTEAV